RRRHLVSLTAKGRQQLTRLRTRIDRLEDGLFAPLDSKERHDLHEMLLRLAAHHEPDCFPGPWPSVRGAMPAASPGCSPIGCAGCTVERSKGTACRWRRPRSA